MKALKARLSRRKVIRLSSAYPLLVSKERNGMRKWHWGKFIWWERRGEAGVWRSQKPRG